MLVILHFSYYYIFIYQFCYSYIFMFLVYCKGIKDIYDVTLYKYTISLHCLSTDGAFDFQSSTDLSFSTS